jgi:lipopolysaccharide transport system permease protein
MGQEGPLVGAVTATGGEALTARRDGTPCTPEAGPGGVPNGPRATLRAVTARSEAPASFRSSGVRPGPLDLIVGGVREVLSRRRLIVYMVRADLKKSGSDTLLGNVWWVVDPLLQMLIYSLLVTLIFDRKIEDYGLFVFSGILPWKWFESTVKDGVTAVTSQERLIKQIYFPKLVLPVSAVSAGIVNFSFGLIPLVGLTVLLYPHRLSAWLLLIPVVAVVQFVFSLAVATTLSAANVFYRDVGNLARHLLRFWFYLSPILYSADVILKSDFGKEHPWMATVYNLNPWTHLVASYRNLAYYHTAPDWGGLAGLLLASLVMVAAAILLFKRVEPTFAKVL